MYGLLSIIETDVGCIIQSDIREGLDRSTIKLRANGKTNQVILRRYGEVLAHGTFSQRNIEALMKAPNIVLTYEDGMTGNLESMYIKQAK